jgi:predicted acetyltransferase
VQGGVEVEPAAQHFQEPGLEEEFRRQLLVVAHAPILLERGVPRRGRAGLGERDDAVDVEDEDRAGGHGLSCYSKSMELVVPSLDRLPAYADALRRGFWSDNLRREESAREELARIAADPAAFVASLDDPEAKGPPITLPDGSTVPRLPGYRRWMWDDGFCGSVNFRWQRGTSDLPKHVLGHLGYAVVPWKQRRGYATKALALMLPQARQLGLAHVDLTTDPDNLPSQKVITANGGILVERFTKAAGHGGGETLLFRIPLARTA